MKISSAANPRIKQIVKLKDRRARRETGLTVVEGVKEISVAQQSGLSFKEYYVCPELLARHAKGDFLPKINRSQIPVYEMPKELFAKIAFGDRLEGILAVVEPSLRALKDIAVDAESIFVVVEDVEKPGNLGAILRTCDAAGVRGLLVTDTATDIYNPNVIRASLGTVFSVPVVQASSTEILSFLEKNHVQLIASSPQAKLSYGQMQVKFSVAFVVGSEHEGLSDFWLKAAAVQVRIPMKGHIDSLNVSATVAILVYETMRQKGC